MAVGQVVLAKLKNAYFTSRNLQVRGFEWLYFYSGVMPPPPNMVRRCRSTSLP